MLLSMMSITAFASGLTAEQEANKAAQVVYAGGTEEVVAEEVVADKVWMTKTAETTDTEGKFKVTLQVETKDKIKTVEKIVEVEKIVNVPETITVERIVKVPEIIEKPVVKLHYRTKYVRNPVEFIALGVATFIFGILIGLIL